MIVKKIFMHEIEKKNETQIKILNNFILHCL